MVPIRIMDINFNPLGEIDDYLSLIWVRRWHKPGEFSLYLDINSLYANTLQENNLVVLGKNVGIIKYKKLALGEEDEDMAESVLIRGLTLSSLVNRRITLPPQGQSHDTIKGTAETVMKHYVKNNCVNPTDIKRRIPRLVVAADLSRGEELTYQSRLKALDLELEQLSLISGLGWDINPDYSTGNLVFDVSEGRDLTSGQTINNPVIFSIDFDNIKGQSYVSSSMDYKNQAYVGGQGEGVERTIIEVGDNAEGLDRYETFVDARDVKNEELLSSRGREKLLELAKLQSFESKVDHDSTFKYKKDWDLGDIVTVQNKKWGVTLNSRITEVTEIYELDGFKLEATFGNTIPTLIDKIKRDLDIPLIEKGEGGGVSSWEDIPDKPTEYPPSSHEHSEYLRNDGGRISGIYSNGKRFYNILNYLYTSRATSGFKIKTNIPEKSTKMVTLKLLGYDYGGSTPVDMSIVFYTYSSGIVNLGACSASEFKPPITLAVENGKIVVFIEGNLYFFNFALDAYVHTNTDESFFEGWSVVVDEEISSNATEIKTVPYRE